MKRLRSENMCQTLLLVKLHKSRGKFLQLYLLEMTMASLNSLRQFWRSAVRPPLVMTALVPCSWWNRRSLVVFAPPTEQGLPGDMAVGPSELSSGRGGRSTESKRRRKEILLDLKSH